MEKAASLTLAEIYIHAHEQTAIPMALHLPNIWELYFNDIY